jgi:hypothetical protein
VARRKLTEAEKAEKSRRNYEAYVKIYEDIDREVEERERRLRPSAIIIRFPVERSRKPIQPSSTTDLSEGYSDGTA